MKKLSVLLSLFLLTYASAQQRRAVGLSPVPLWPASGNTSSLPQGQYVFYSSPEGEYVVSFPANLSDPEGPRTTLRFSSHALTDPQISSMVTNLGDGQFQYSFLVANGPMARTAIDKWRITTPSNSTVNVAGQEAIMAGWQPTANAFEASGTEMLVHGQHALQTIEWSTQSGGIGKQGVRSGFVVRSPLLPGFVVASVRGHAQRELTDRVKESLPKEVQMQVDRVQTPTWDSQSRLVLGPRFTAGASREEVAANFFQGITSLSRHGALDRNSSFVSQALEVLNNSLQNNIASALTTDSMPFLAQASSELERAIASAMEINFRAR